MELIGTSVDIKEGWNCLQTWAGSSILLQKPNIFTSMFIWNFMILDYIPVTKDHVKVSCNRSFFVTPHTDAYGTETTTQTP